VPSANHRGKFDSHGNANVEAALEREQALPGRVGVYGSERARRSQLLGVSEHQYQELVAMLNAIRWWSHQGDGPSYGGFDADFAQILNVGGA
jgi:hypothetical protein